MAGNKDIFKKAMNQGHSAAWDQEWDKAAKFYRAALSEIPNHPQALTSLGLALFELHDFLTSLEYYQKAITVSPEDPIPQEKIARIFEQTGQNSNAIHAYLQAAELHLKARSIEKTIENWRRILDLQPDNISVRVKLAGVYEKMGRKEDAVSEYLSTASYLQQSGDTSRAIKAIESAFKIMPDNQEVRLSMSLIRSNQLLPKPSKSRGAIGPSQSHYSVINDQKKVSGTDEIQDPISESLRKALAHLASMMFDQPEDKASGENQSHIRGISALAQGTGDSKPSSGDKNRIILHLGQAIDSQTHGDVKQAIEELEHALNLGFRQPSAYYILGLLVKEINIEKALKYLQQSVRHPDYNLASNILIAQAYESIGAWNKAATSYLQALAIADSQIVLPNQADELMEQYDALIDSQIAVENQSELRVTCNSISNQLMRNNWRTTLHEVRNNLSKSSEGTQLVPVAEVILESNSTQVVDSMVSVRKLASKGLIGSAYEEALYALQFAPTYMPLHALIGDLLLQDGRELDAIQKFLVISELYTVRGEILRAIRLLKRVTQIMPTDIGIRQRLIDLLVAQDKIDEALDEYSSLADLYYDTADLDKARQTCLEALRIAQKSKDNRSWGLKLLLRVADIDMQRINLRQALKTYEQIRSLQPDHTFARAQIVSVNFRLGQDAAAMKECDEYVNFLEKESHQTRAIDFLKELIVDHTDRPDLRRRIADLYIRRKQLVEAVDQLEQAANTLINDNEDKHMDAINILEMIISLDPPNKQKYHSALENMRRKSLRK